MNKKYVAISLSIITLLFIVILFIYWSQHNQATISKSEPAEKSYDSWQSYSNDTFGFTIKYPPTFEVLINDPNGKKYPDFRDKKYDGAFVWPGLTLDFDPIPELEAYLASNNFNIKDIKNGVIRIFLTNGSGKKMYATCSLYAQNEEENLLMLDVCNGIVSTLKINNLRQSRRF